MRPLKSTNYFLLSCLFLVMQSYCSSKPPVDEQKADTKTKKSQFISRLNKDDSETPPADTEDPLDKTNKPIPAPIDNIPPPIAEDQRENSGIVPPTLPTSPSPENNQLNPTQNSIQNTSENLGEKNLKTSNSLKRIEAWGGTIRAMAMDDANLVTASAFELNYYSSDLKLLDRTPLRAPATQIVITKNHQALIKEEEVVTDITGTKTKKTILETVQLSNTGFGTHQQFTISGNLYFLPKSGLIAVAFADHIQWIDPQTSTLINDVAIAGITDLLEGDNVDYALIGKKLSVINRATGDITATIDLGVSADLIGLIDSATAPLLITAIKKESSVEWEGYLTIHLTNDKQHFADFGSSVSFTNPVNSIEVGPQNTLILKRSDALNLFDPVKQLEMENPTNNTKGEVAFTRSQTKLIFATKNEIITGDLQLLPLPTSGKVTLTTPVATNGKGTPWQLQKINKTVYAGTLRNLFLIGPSTLVAYGDTPHQLFGSNQLLTQTSPKLNNLPINLTDVDVTTLRVGGNQFYVMDEKKNRLWSLPTDFSALTEIKNGPKKVIAFEVSTVADKTLIWFLTNGLKKGERIIALYEQTNQDLVKLVKKSTTSVKEECQNISAQVGIAHLFIACGSAGITEITAEDTTKPTVTLFSLPTPLQKVLDVKSLVGGNSLLLYGADQNTEGLVALVQLEAGQLKTPSFLERVTLTNEEFKGITLSLGGKKILIPSTTGLRIVANDGTNLVQTNIWNIGPITKADVMLRGQVICVAAGDQGIICGE